MDQPPNGGYETRDQIAEAATANANLAATRAVEYDCLARDSANQVLPRYLFVPRSAGSLACGELVVEPVLGPVRVAGVDAVARSRGDQAFVRVAWSDDYGPCHPVGCYPVDESVMVRVPDFRDRLFVRRGMDQAAWVGREVSGPIARRIAAHVHLGPRSALYGFAINGAVPEQMYDELNRVHTNQPAYRPWVTALARYCLDRKGTGPIPGWGPASAGPVWDTVFPPDHEHAPERRRRDREAQTTGEDLPLVGDWLPTETAVRLMDEAFILGVAARRSRAYAALILRFLGQHDADGP